MTLLFQSGKSVKDKVIITLGYAWPLKAKEILSYIKKNFNANVTYQAVYKSINELLADGVILKTDDGLTLDKEWVGSLKDYSAYIDQFYKLGVPKKDIIGSEQITVESVWDWYYYAMTIIEKLSNDDYVTERPVVIRGTHEWNGMFFRKEEIERIAKVIKKYQIYTVAEIDNPFAEAMIRYWEDLGVHVARATPETFIEVSNEILVIGDYVIQAMLPIELRNELGKFYDGAIKVEDIDMTKMQRVFYKKANIDIITVKNKILADRIRKETLVFFK